MNTDSAVLILEDEMIIGLALVDMLEELGFERIELAANLTQARQCLESAKPDIAILDVNIHGDRSYGIAEELQDQGIPIIFATGNGDAEHPESLKLIPTLIKPYNQDELSAILSTLR